jgi:uncharacterized protein (TIGR03089 family)
MSFRTVHAVSTSTFPGILSAQLHADGSRPLVTFYDDATGERIELSVVTYANWVSKTAGLVQDELEVERGGLVLLDLPTHWLGAVWLGAAWTGGLCVTTDPGLAATADLVVCGPDGVPGYAELAVDRPVVAISLRPLGGRFVDALPDGVTDYGAVVLAQPDTFVSYDPPSSDDTAWRAGDDSLTQASLLAAAEADPVVAPRGRLLTDVNPCSGPGLSTLVSPLLQGASTVWVANPDASGWTRRYDEERATALLRATLS